MQKDVTCPKISFALFKMLPPSQKETVFDLIGLGFGPANIAIACALTEDWENQKVR